MIKVTYSERSNSKIKIEKDFTEEEFERNFPVVCILLNKMYIHKFAGNNFKSATLRYKHYTLEVDKKSLRILNKS